MKMYWLAEFILISSFYMLAESCGGGSNYQDPVYYGSTIYGSIDYGAYEYGRALEEDSGFDKKEAILLVKKHMIKYNEEYTYTFTEGDIACNVELLESIDSDDLKKIFRRKRRKHEQFPAWVLDYLYYWGYLHAHNLFCDEYYGLCYLFIDKCLLGTK